MLILFKFFAFVSASLLCYGATNDTSLVFVHILFRHGDRTPVELYPTDPNPPSTWPEGLGQLTLLGKWQLYALGKHFRFMYQHFLTTNPIQLSVNSSAETRCLESAEANLASFYAPKQSWQFDKEFDWQPIAVHYIPDQEDEYLGRTLNCPRALQEQGDIVKSPAGQRFIKKHEQMFKYLTYHCGFPITDWTRAFDLYDTLSIERQDNLTFPSWAVPYWGELTEVNNLAFYWMYRTVEIQRLFAGPLFQFMIEKMQMKISGLLPDKKIHLYSTHDKNIAAVMNALKVFNMLQPPYAASLIFELHKMKDGNHSVRLLYLNSSTPQNIDQPSHLLILEGCSEFCPLEFFINYTRPFMLTKPWSVECQIDPAESSNKIIGIISIVIVVILIAVVSLFLWRKRSKNRNKHSYQVL